MGEQATDCTGGRNIILTTPGASGSTCFCEALNRIPNVVALNEPIALRFYREHTTAQVCQKIRSVFRSARESLVLSGTARQLVRGDGLCNTDFGQRQEPFDLVIKQPLTFTALIGQNDLDDLVWYVLVRNPLFTLCSWVKNSRRLQAGREGRATTAEMHAPELRCLLDGLTRDGSCMYQLRLALLNWAFGKYAQLPRERVIRYEDFVAAPTEALARLVPAARQVQGLIPIRNGNANPAYLADAERFALRVLAEPPEAPIWRYYTREEIRDGLHALGLTGTS